ncbi:MAG: penicillin acylase family protein [Desulfurococcales archaeon]|nr:penicillin acylase family protein [Desulfurococcales archaeon]
MKGGVKSYIALLTSLIIIVLIMMTPIGFLLELSNPYRGVVRSAEAGIIPSELELKADGLSSDVVIRFDNVGVPHIEASNERDAFFAVGFIHAWFRLWQMDIQRRLASGMLAEVIGEDALKNDVYMRIIGLRRSAEATSEWIKANYPYVYSLLEAYSNGVNYAINLMNKNGNLPLMFKLLGYKPEPWTPVDSLVWAKYMAWTLTNFWYPLHLSLLASKLDYEDMKMLYPVHPYYADNVTVIPGDGEINGKRINLDPYMLRNLNWFEEWATGLDFKDPEFAKKLEDAVMSILDLVGERPKGIGSNNWAVAPSRSLSGYAMMADDPHLPLNLPSLWYMLHIRTNDGLEVYGATLPGIPFVIIGYNRYISWGLTNTQIGVMDFYVEKVDPENPLLYYYEGRWLEMKQVEETIKVKGGDDVVLKVNLTIHGPVLTTKGLTISFKWTGNAGFMNDNSGVTREAVAIYLVNKARNLNEFLDALRLWDVPSQNFMYADVEGHIAVIEPGLFPLRKVTIPSGEEVLVVSSRSLLNGTGGYEWIGYIPFEDLPASIDPPRGFLAAPNQMSVGPYYPYFILGAWWDPGSRAHRIFMLLSSKDKHSIDDMKMYQYDAFDWYAYSVLKVMLNAAESYGSLSGKASRALELLKDWDYVMDKDEVAPTIWWAWFSALQDYLYKDYLKSHGINVKLYPTPDATTWLILNMRDSKWFKEGFEVAMAKTLEEAVSALEEYLGQDMDEWEWGRLHVLLLNHLSGLDPLSRGLYQIDGGDDVLLNTPIPWDLEALKEKPTIAHGPSLRFLTLMYSQGLEECRVRWIYPGGQSGNPVSSYYDNLIDDWINGDYIKWDCAGEAPSLIGSIILKAGG